MLDIAESPLYDIEQEFREQHPGCPIKVILGDVKNKKKMKEVFKESKPQVVFHAAAYKHVPMMEKYPEEAIHANVIGTKILADLSVLAQVEKFVFVSTDKAVNPTNVMGATKRAAEMYVQALNEYLEVNHKKIPYPIYYNQIWKCVGFKWLSNSAVQKANHEWGTHFRDPSGDYPIFYDHT